MRMSTRRTRREEEKEEEEELILPWLRGGLRGGRSRGTLEARRSEDGPSTQT